MSAKRSGKASSQCRALATTSCLKKVFYTVERIVIRMLLAGAFLRDTSGSLVAMQQSPVPDLNTFIKSLLFSLAGSAALCRRTWPANDIRRLRSLAIFCPCLARLACVKVEYLQRLANVL